MPKAETEPLTHTKRWVEIDLADTEVTIDEFPDGAFGFNVTGNNEPLVVNAEQCREILRAFAIFRKEKGW